MQKGSLEVRRELLKCSWPLKDCNIRTHCSNTRTGSMYIEVLIGLVVGGVIFLLVLRRRSHVLKTEDGWWGFGPVPDGEQDANIYPFKVTTSDEELEDLHRRIDQTRAVPSLEDSQFNYGFNLEYLEKVKSYWRNDFDWRQQVDKLNQYPHFKTKIEGIDVHYVHVKPKRVPEGTDPIPLIMVHGWPGSFYEFYKTIPLLTEPSEPQNLVFEVVCPSIPGYGYSEAPHKKGFDSICAARIFHKLMRRLGFQQFYAHGGDWGWLVTTNMAQLKPKTVKGLHLNFAPPCKPGLTIILSILLGRHFPKLFGFTSVDLERLYPCFEKLFVEAIKETGYMHIQATKPDTAGRGLNDSPVGLAAYILEKFSTCTSQDFRNLEDGGLTRMLVSVPTGFACFPNELMHTPKLWVQQKFHNLLTYTYMARGGHFAAMEEPQLMVEDINNFIQKVEKMTAH
ncbi:epoxide hydrolase 1-like isoform X2 [Corythoichthys intestinalis]|uniref:epoxide hydrolase 1-like isoform X2 n=1 Tax=Corythoichthys intestinalis TaxID=161448 RepID=UPI0025A55510|nr:epoxide hydrolase 1-like isoform X2 [Corythoichthys intestinalis]